MTPECPLHGPMKKVTISQGEGDEEIILGYAWFCVNDDTGSPDYCDYCEDCDDPMPAQEPRQMSMFDRSIA